MKISNTFFIIFTFLSLPFYIQSMDQSVKKNEAEKCPIETPQPLEQCKEKKQSASNEMYFYDTPCGVVSSNNCLNQNQTYTGFYYFFYIENQNQIRGTLLEKI